MQKDKIHDPTAYEGEEILRVRAYGSSFFTLGINTRYSSGDDIRKIKIVATQYLVLD